MKGIKRFLDGGKLVYRNVFCQIKSRAIHRFSPFVKSVDSLKVVGYAQNINAVALVILRRFLKEVTHSNVDVFVVRDIRGAREEGGEHSLVVHLGINRKLFLNEPTFGKNEEGGFV